MKVAAEKGIESAASFFRRRFMSKPFLFITCTHGDEPIGQEVLDRISRSGKFANVFDCIIGNPRARRLNKRFVDVDLNRNAPGKYFSFSYEIRRASKILKKTRTYPFVIDLHQTLANDRIVVIVTKITRENIALALQFDIDTILLWPASQPERSTGPLVSYVPAGVEIESGVKTDLLETVVRLQNILEQFLRTHSSLMTESLSIQESGFSEKQFYLVRQKISQEDLTSESLEDFIEYHGRHDAFIPLLFGRHAGLLGYKMSKVDPLNFLK